MTNDLIDHETQEFLGEVGIKLCLCGELAQTRNLPIFAPRIGCGETCLRLVPPHRLGDLETLGEHVDEGGIDVIDTVPISLQLTVGHGVPHVDGLAIARASRQRNRTMTATIHALHGTRQPSLDPLLTLVATDLNAVNHVILERMQSEIPLIPELAGHLIAGGGKRMRPMLTLACARLLDYPGTRHHKLAAAVEFIHTATLLHDDVVDGSGLRRGKRTANMIWGNPASVLVGDFLFSRSFELMVEDGSLKVLRILSNASAVIAEGEVNQLTAQRQIGLGEDRYLAIIAAKTAVLFAAACKIAAVVAERDESVEAALDAYGRNLGIAFQLVDDAIDYASDAETMGKGVGDDFRDGKVTLPVILAYARGSETDRRFWKEAMEGRRNSDDDLAHGIGLLHATGAINDALQRARHYGQRAIDALGPFASSSAKAALAEAVEFAVARAY